MARTKGAKDKSSRKKREPIAVPTSKSSDEEILTFLRGVNSKLSGYYKVAGEAVGEQQSARVQRLLTFDKWKEGGGYEQEQLEMVDGKIPLRSKVDKQTAIDYVKRALRRQEEKAAKEKDLPDPYKAKSLTQELDAIPTVQKKIERVEEELKTKTSYTGEKLTEREEEEKKREYARRAKEMAIREMQERATIFYEDTVSEAIQKLYDEYGPDYPLLAELRGGRWSPDTLEQVDLEAHGIHTKGR